MVARGVEVVGNVKTRAPEEDLTFPYAASVRRVRGQDAILAIAKYVWFRLGIDEGNKFRKIGAFHGGFRHKRTTLP